MKSNSHDDSLEALLTASYDRLRRPLDGQREAVLAGVAPALAGRRHVSRRQVSRRRWRLAGLSLAAAACLLAVLGLEHFLPSQVGPAYGLDAIGQRMREVQTIRIRGSRSFYNDERPAEKPIRVPLEYLVKRPDKYRTVWWGLSHSKTMVIRTGTESCDGRQRAGVYDADKKFYTEAVSPLGARVRTELKAQLFIACELSPPGTDFTKAGQEVYRGRKCDRYEGRSGAGSDFRLTTVWFDPATGYPLRLATDSRAPGGSLRRDVDYEEIAVNVPLADELFQFEAPAGFERLGPIPQAVDGQPQLLDSATMGCAAGGTNVELWNALRIADNAALVFWRRSAPEPGPDGVSDWLANLQWARWDSKATGQTPRHAWLYNSMSPDAWSWSLVVVADGPWGDPASLGLRLERDGGSASVELLAINFSDDDLTQIIAAAATALPADVPKPSLEAMRAKAKEMSAEPAAP